MKNFLLILLMIGFLGTTGYIVDRDLVNPGPVIQMKKWSDTLRIIDRTAYITLSGRIDLGTYHEVQTDVRTLITLGIKDVHLNMCSGGGGMVYMWSIYDILKNAIDLGQIRLTTHANGIIASAAVPIYLLGETRTIGTNAHMMIHAHSGKVQTYRSPSENEMLETWTQRWINVLENRTKMSREDLLKHMATGLDQKKDALFFNAQAAVDYGFATQIK